MRTNIVAIGTRPSFFLTFNIDGLGTRLSRNHSSEYYGRSLTIPMLDLLITELDNCFEEEAAGIVGELL